MMSEFLLGNTDIVLEVGKLENLLGTEKLDKNSIRMRND